MAQLTTPRRGRPAPAREAAMEYLEGKLNPDPRKVRLCPKVCGVPPWMARGMGMTVDTLCLDSFDEAYGRNVADESSMMSEESVSYQESGCNTASPASSVPQSTALPVDRRPPPYLVGEALPSCQHPMILAASAPEQARSISVRRPLSQARSPSGFMSLGSITRSLSPHPGRQSGAVPVPSGAPTLAEPRPPSTSRPPRVSRSTSRVPLEASKRASVVSARLSMSMALPPGSQASSRQGTPYSSRQGTPSMPPPTQPPLPVAYPAVAGQDRNPTPARIMPVSASGHAVPLLAAGYGKARSPSPAPGIILHAAQHSDSLNNTVSTRVSLASSRSNSTSSLGASASKVVVAQPQVVATQPQVVASQPNSRASTPMRPVAVLAHPLQQQKQQQQQYQRGDKENVSVSVNQHFAPEKAQLMRKDLIKIPTPLRRPGVPMTGQA